MFKRQTYTYPVSEEPAIKNLNLDIERGKFYGIIGNNGSGKSTLCAILRGFAPAYFKGKLDGEVIFNGKDISQYGYEISKMIGYVFQNPFTQISGIKETVFEEIAYGLENFGIPIEEIEKRVVEVMKLTNTEELAMKNPYELSGGQMQRVALASVIVLNPDVLIIDEPTSQLDPQGTESVFEIIRKLKEQRKTIILVEHKIDLIAEFTDRVVILKDGEILKEGDTKSVLTDISLLEHGIAIPQVTQLAIQLKEIGLPINSISVTEEDLLNILKSLLYERG